MASSIDGGVAWAAQAEMAAIIQIATELDESVDHKDWPRLRSFLADEMTVEVGVVAGEGASAMSADAFVAEVAAFNLPRKIACHSFSNPIVRLDGDRAVFTANRYGWNLCDDFDPPLYELWGRIAYGFRKDADGLWRIDRLGMEVLRDAGNLEVSQLRA